MRADAAGASASMVNIAQSEILELVIAVPGLREKREMVNSIDQDMAKIDNLTSQAERTIELLQERRTALISAAATGQLDVRNLSQSTEVDLSLFPQYKKSLIKWGNLANTPWTKTQWHLSTSSKDTNSSRLLIWLNNAVSILSHAERKLPKATKPSI